MIENQPLDKWLEGRQCHPNLLGTLVKKNLLGIKLIREPSASLVARAPDVKLAPPGFELQNRSFFFEMGIAPSSASIDAHSFLYYEFISFRVYKSWIT
jgi:hypothetical protein